MTTQELLDYAKEMIAKHPNLKEDISDIFEDCIQEIEDGNEEYQECETTHETIRQLVEEQE